MRRGGGHLFSQNSFIPKGQKCCLHFEMLQFFGPLTLKPPTPFQHFENGAEESRPLCEEPHGDFMQRKFPEYSGNK
jgi:hypothetical protein